MQLYTIYDKLAQEGGPLFEAKNDEIARRNFSKLITDNNADVSDFIMYNLGRFDRESLDMFVHDKVEVVTN